MPNLHIGLTDQGCRGTLHRSHLAIEVWSLTQRPLMRRCRVHRLMVVAFAALCLIGTSSFALADDAMKSEMGQMKEQMKADKDSMKADIKGKNVEMKAKTKAPKEAKKEDMKGKAKAHKAKMKAKADGHSAAVKSAGQEMKTSGQ